MKYISIFIGLILHTYTFGQNNSPCSTIPYQDFDFWLGDWDVFDADRSLVGNNKIEKKDQGCWIMENWIGSKGSTGSSMNYYNPKDSTWNQLWLDNNGTRLILKGRLVKGQMILEDTDHNPQQLETINRITWTPHDDGTVSQIWKSVDKINQSEKVLFYGLYRKQN